MRSTKTAGFSDVLERRILLTQLRLTASTNHSFEGNNDAITLVATTTEPVVGRQEVSVSIEGIGFTDSDYVLENARLVFPDGATKATTTLRVIDDNVVEQPEQSVRVELVDPTDGLRTNVLSRYGLTIFDNDRSTVSISDSTANETDRTIDLTVALSNPVDIDTWVELSTVDGIATAGEDYLPLDAQRVSIPAGDTSITVSVPLIDDLSSEADEQFEVAVTGIEASERDVSYRRERLDRPAAQSTVMIGEQLSPDGRSIIFLSKRDGDTGLNLFRVPVVGGTVERLTSDVGPRQGIHSFQISPDGQFVVFRADRLLDETFELFSLRLNDGVISNLSHRPAQYGDVDTIYEITSDSQRVVYRAAYDVSIDNALYSVPIAGGTITRLSHADTTSDRVTRFRLSSDATTVVFSTSYGAAIFDELYSVPVTGGVPVKLNEQPPVGGNISKFEISPTNNAVVFIASNSLFANSLSGDNHTVLQDAQSSLHVSSFVISPDGNHVAFISGSFSFRVADLNSGQSMELLPGVSLSRYRFTPDSQRLVMSSFLGGLRSVAVAGGSVVQLDGTPTSDAINGDFVIAPNSQEVIFAGKEGFQEEYLYAAPLDGSTSRRILSYDGQAIERWKNLWVSPDGADVLFFSTGSDGRRQLYRVPRGGGSHVRLNSDLIPGGDVQESFLYSEQTDRIVYSADLEFNEVYENLSVPRAGGTSINLADWTQPRGIVESFQLAPGDQHAVYIANHRTSNHRELFSVDLTTKVVTRISHLLVLSEDVTDFQISSDGQRVVYRTDSRELYSVEIDGGTPVLINDNQFGSVNDYQISPDSQNVVYKGFYMAVVPIAGGASTALVDELGSGGVIREFVITSDSQWVVYRSDKLIDNKEELFRVPIEGGQFVRVSGEIDDVDSVMSEWAISPDLQYVVYTTSNPTGSVWNLFRSDFLTGSAVQLNPTFDNGGRVTDFKVTSDAQRVVFRTGQIVRDFELFSVLSNGDGLVRLNTDLTTNQSLGVDQFQVSPDGKHVVFSADLNVRQRLEIFSTPVTGGTLQRLNPDRRKFSEFDRFLISDDSETVFMELTPTSGGFHDIYAAPLTGGAARMLSRTTDTTSFVGYNIVDYSHGRLFYIEDKTGQETLYQVDPRTARSSMVSAPQGIGRQTDQHQVLNDGSAILYRGLATYNNEAGIFRSDLSTSATATIVDVDDGRPRFVDSVSVTGNLKPQFSWSSVDDATSYDVQITLLGGDEPPLVDTTVAASSFATTSQLGIGRYRIQVRARFGDGSSTEWGSTVFRVDVPVHVVQPDRQQSDLPTVAWGAVPGAISYQVVVRNNTNQTIWVDEVVSEPRFEFPTADFGEHSVWVRAIGNHGFHAGWGSRVEVAVGPQLITPAASAFAYGWDFEWTDVTGADSFQLVVKRDNEVVIDQSGLTGTTFRPDLPFQHGNYKSWIRGFTADGMAGPWSRARDFSAGGRPIGVVLTDITLDGVATISWLPVSGAVKYEIYLQSEGDNRLIQREANLVDTEFLTHPLPAGHYRFWLRAFLSDNVFGRWTEGISIHST